MTDDALAERLAKNKAIRERELEDLRASLAQARKAYADTKTSFAEAEANRNRLVAIAREFGMPATEVAEALDLKRDAVYKIMERMKSSTED